MRPVERRGVHIKNQKPPTKSGGGLSGIIESFLPGEMEACDLLLLAILLFLYLESEDEEFLIMLIVVGFSMFRGEGQKS